MSMSVRMSWHGDEVLARVETTKPMAVKDGLEHLLEASLKLVPRESGALARSGRVDEDSGTVSYGSNGVPYAIVQHERLDYHHFHGGQAKYLEQPMLTEAGVIQRIIAEHYRAALR